MSLEDAGQKRVQARRGEGGQGEAPDVHPRGNASTVTRADVRSGTDRLMEEVVERENLFSALKRVEQNKGSAGIDGMATTELRAYLKVNWPRIREELMNGTYRPRPVRRVDIPKPGGGTRQLGIPTALDRFMQQAMLQVLQRHFDSSFSEHSYGFRPGRSAHQAVEAAKRYIESGKTWVVDCDLEKMFDRINHDVLVGRLAKRIADKRLLKLVRSYLEAGVMLNGVASERHEGTPQGGPASPFLANFLLDEVDKELERRGLSFCRYADDQNVYVSSERAAKEVLATLRKLYGKLRLKVNEAKSGIGRPWERKFLGFSFTAPQKGSGKVKRRVAEAAIARFKATVRERTGRNGGKSIKQVVENLRSYMLGWRNYFRVAEQRKDFIALDEWTRRRLRAMQLKQWKRGTTVFAELRARGIDTTRAAIIARFSRRYWRTATNKAMYVALPNSLYDGYGLPKLAATPTAG